MKSWFNLQLLEYISYMQYYIWSIFCNAFMKSIMSWLLVIFFFLFWDINILVQSTAVIYIIDFSLWMYTAYTEDNFCIKRFWAWMTKLMLYAILVILFNQADIVIWAMIWHPSLSLHIISAKSWAITYISMHELISSLNKLKHLWVPIPEKLYQAIKTNKEKIWW